MTPGERVDIITKLARELSTRPWDDVDLALRQFGFSWSTNWDGNQYGYVVHHIEDGTDDQLITFHQYLFPAQASGEPAIRVEGRWADGLFRLFLSHTSANKVFVSALKPALASHA